MFHYRLTSNFSQRKAKENKNSYYLVKEHATNSWATVEPKRFIWLIPKVVNGSRKRHFGSFQWSSLITYLLYLALPWHCDEFTFLLLSLQMQFNETNAPDETSVQANKPMEHMNCNQVLLQNCSAIPDGSAAWETLLQKESVEQFQQETKQTMNNLHFKGHRYTRTQLTDRREKNRERERKRQARLKGAFNVLRSVIPDYFSKREPGDRLSRIQTLRLAKKYIATLHELLETC